MPMHMVSSLSGWRRLNRWAERVGRFVLGLVEDVGVFANLVIRTWRVGARLHWLTSAAVMHVIMRQIYFTGVQALPWVALLGIVGGGYAVFQIARFAQQVSDLSLIGRMAGGVILEELAPLAVTLFLVARSGVAVAAEIGGMYVRGEQRALVSMGIMPEEYLFWPRALAFALAGLVLSLVFASLAIMGGMVWAAQADVLPATDFFFELRRTLSLGAGLALVIKGTLYPTLAALVLIERAVRVGSDPNMIPVRASQGVLASIVLVAFGEVVFGVLEGILA